MLAIRIVLIADDPLARAGLAALLRDQPDVNVVAQISADENLAEQIETFAADVLVWDFGFDAAQMVERVLEAAQIQPRILALVHDEAEINSAWAHSVRGILPRDASAEKLRAALEAILRGLMVLDESLAIQLPATRSFDQRLPVEELTPREMQVLELLARGMANKMIASELGISEHTVKFHVNAILGKLGAQSRTDAVVRATRLGLITL
ncbi:MAG: response regulator transcription factor [Chloroflexi bacterium]|nr:response regulator transcription factor [Chloroflexota bacterium]